MATKSKSKSKNSLATRSNGSGKNIASILDPNNAPIHARKEALRRTLLARKLCTSRCTTPQELKERFDQLFEVAFNERLRPYCRNAWIMFTVLLVVIYGILKMVEAINGDGMSDIVKNAKELIGSAEGLLALDGELNSTVYIFRAKNYQGMTDKQEVVVTPNSIPQEQANAEDIINNLPGIGDNKPLQLEDK